MRRGALAVLAALGAAACAQDNLDAGRPPPTLDPAFFRCSVEPVLVARCAFFACHGSQRRPLRLFARQRLRLDVPADARAQPLTPDEEQANYDAARGFAGDGERPPLLLLKPLDVDAGGWYHGAKALYGRVDVFAAADDPGYRLIAAWIQGGAADPGCTPTEEVGP